MLSLECTISGEVWSADQLARVEYARHVHVLHDLNRRGVPVELGHHDIDRLAPGAAEDLSVRTRSALDVDHLRELFADELRDSRRMWSEAGDAAPGADMRAAVADLTIHGLTPDELRAGLAGPRPAYTRLHPDHFAMTVRGRDLYVMETFGMYGGPTEMTVVADPTMPPPVEPAAGYEPLTSGYATVLGIEQLRMPVFHQIAATGGGLGVKLGAFFPPGTPGPVVEGHGLHMAIEFWHLARTVAVPPRP